MVTDYIGTWADPIIQYIQHGALPTERDQARRLKIRAARYLMIGDVLYRRSFSLPCLRCLTPPEAERAMNEVHEGDCGDHQGGRMLSYKLIRAGYYWPTMTKDCANKVKTCPQCQKFANISHSVPTTLMPLRSPWPFAQWGLEPQG